MSNRVYDKLDVRTLINGKGTYTVLGGSIMPPGVVKAMVEASKNYVGIHELQQKVGQRLAELTGAQAAYVATGAAAALVECTAACVAGCDPEKIARLPDTTGMKSQVIIQKAHRTRYDQAISQVGVKLVEVETEEQMESAISEQTAAIAHIAVYERDGAVSLSDAIKIAKAADVPFMVDAAGELPPAENLTRFIKMGADFVTFSGGKGLRGPQASGLVLGRKDIISACLANSSPNHSIGRPMKAGKEEIVGLLTAVELYIQKDHEAEWRRWEGQIGYIADVLSDIDYVETGRVPDELMNHVPRLYIKFDENKVRMTPDEMLEVLRNGEPSIELLTTEMGVAISTNTLMEGDEKVIAKRLREILTRKGTDAHSSH